MFLSSSERMPNSADEKGGGLESHYLSGESQGSRPHLASAPTQHPQSGVSLRSSHDIRG